MAVGGARMGAGERTRGRRRVSSGEAVGRASVWIPRSERLRTLGRRPGRDAHAQHDDGADCSGYFSAADGGGVEPARMRDARREAMERSDDLQCVSALDRRYAADFLGEQLAGATAGDCASDVEFVETVASD